jgi:hypothetical protein
MFCTERMERSEITSDAKSQLARLGFPFPPLGPLSKLVAGCLLQHIMLFEGVNSSVHISRVMQTARANNPTLVSCFGDQTGYSYRIAL